MAVQFRLTTGTSLLYFRDGKKTICHSAADRRLGCIITTYCTISCLVTIGARTLQIHTVTAEESFCFLRHISKFSPVFGSCFLFPHFPILTFIIALFCSNSKTHNLVLQIICFLTDVHIFSRACLSLSLLRLPLSPFFSLPTLLHQHFDRRRGAGVAVLMGGVGGGVGGLRAQRRTVDISYLHLEGDTEGRANFNRVRCMTPIYRFKDPVNGRCWRRLT